MNKKSLLTLAVLVLLSQSVFALAPSNETGSPDISSAYGINKGTSSGFVTLVFDNLADQITHIGQTFNITTLETSNDGEVDLYFQVTSISPRSGKSTAFTPAPSDHEFCMGDTSTTTVSSGTAIVTNINLLTDEATIKYTATLNDVLKVVTALSSESCSRTRLKVSGEVVVTGLPNPSAP